MCIFKIHIIIILYIYYFGQDVFQHLLSTVQARVQCNQENAIKKTLQLDKLFSSGSQKVSTALAQIKATMVILNDL